MPKYLSGRVRKSTNAELKSDRYKYLSLEQAEPNPSDPKTLGIGDGSSSPSFPTGTKYQVFSVYGDPNPGTRYWQPVGGGIIPGSISVFDEGTVIGGANSITSLNFEGVAIAATSTPPGTGTAATITVAPPGHSGQLLFNLKVGTGITDFSSSDNLVFDPNVGIFTSKTHLHVGLGGSIFSAFSGTSGGVGVASVGIGTSNPTATLHVKGGLRLEGTIYDGDNEPGTAGDLLVKATNSLEWKAPNTVQSGAGGYISNVQYHDDTGLVEGASNFVWDEANTRIGIGSTQPRVLLDVVGIASFSEIQVSGFSTFTDNIFVGTGATVGFGTSAFFPDHAGIYFGDSNDLSIYHDSDHSYISDTGTGYLRITAADYLQLGTGSTYDAFLNCESTSGSVYVNFNGTTKLQTTNTGIDVSGILTASQTLDSPELYINPSGIGTIGNIKISGNVVTTTVGALTIRSNSGTVTTPDKFTVTNTTDSTNADSGALQVDGGVGINKNVFVGTGLSVSGYTAEAPVTYPYKFDNTDTNPGSGELYFNQAEGLADTLSIHESDSNGTNRGNLVLKYIRLGDKITITRTSDSSNTVTFKVTGDAVGAAGATYNIPISYLEGDWTPVSNLTPVNITIHQRGEGSVSLASAGGITTTGGDLYIGGDLFVQDDIFLDEGNFQHLIVNPGIATFRGDIHVGLGNTAAFFDVDKGRVGIGTSVPSDELHVYNQHGDVTIRVESFENSKDPRVQLLHRNDAKWTISNDSSNTHQLEIMGDGGTNDKFLIIKQDGYIGIGEENPSYLLDIKGSSGGDATLQLRNDGVEGTDHTVIRNKIDGVAASNYIYFGDNDDDDVGIIEYDHGDDALKFTVNTGEYLTIESTGIVTSKGPTLFSKQLNVLGVSTIGGGLTVGGATTIAGITTITGDTLFSKQLNVLGVSTIGGGLTVGGATTLTGITTTGNQLFVGTDFSVGGATTLTGIVTTGNDLFVGGDLSVLGVSTFTDNISINAGLKDKDGELGGDGQLLESRSNKVNWVSTSDLTIENANRVGVGTTDAVFEDNSTTVSYYPTFVDSNNNESRENEFLYSDIGLSYSLSYKDGIGIGSVGIGTSNPDTILHVEDDYGSAIFKLEGHSDGDAIVNLRAQGTGIGKIAAWDQLAIGKADATNDIASDGEWMRITSAGLVGIGKDSNLLYQLELQRNSADLLRINNSGETGHGSHDANIIAGGDYYQNPVIGGSTIKFKTFNGSTFDERVTIDPIGNFIVSTETGISTFVGGLHATGIGVSIAAGDLHVTGVSTHVGFSTFGDVSITGLSTHVGFSTFGDVSITGMSTHVGFSTFGDVSITGMSTFIGIATFRKFVGIGTDAIPDFQITDTKIGTGHTLAVAGIVTAYEMYATKFYGPIKGALEPTGDFNIEEWIKHVDDTDTKFGFPNENEFAVYTADSERLKIDANGNFIISAETGISTFVGGIHVTGMSTHVGFSTFGDVSITGMSTHVGFSTFGDVSITGLSTHVGFSTFGDVSITGLSTHVGFSTFGDVSITGLSTHVGFSTFGDVSITGMSTHVGFSTFGDVSITGMSTHVGFSTFGDVSITGMSTHVGFSTFGDISVTGMSTFIGISTFHFIGVGTDKPSDPITEHVLGVGHSIAVAGVVTAYEMYANKFYGSEFRGGTFYGSIDSDVSTSKAETVKITDDTNPTGTHYIHFGDQKGDSGNEYDGVEVDSTGLVYKDGNVGINQIDPNKAKLHVVADTGSAEKIVAKFRNPESVADNKAKIGLVAGYSDTANDLEAHAYVGAQREGSGNNSSLFFETSNGSTVTENLRITSEGNVGIDETDPTKVTSTNTKSLAVGIVTANQVWGSINRVELLKHSDTATASVGQAIILDTMPRSDVDVLEYTFYFKISNDIQSQKLLVMNDDHGTEDNVYSNEYAMMYNEKQLVDVQGFIQSSALSIKATPLVAGTLEYTWVRNLIKHQLNWPA